MQIIEAKLNDLKIDPANVRQTDKAPDDGLLASIREKGLLVPLTVRKNGTGYLVTDGGMRLAALHVLARDGEYDKATLVPCILREDDEANAADISLTTNYIRTAMHPVDEYEAFVKLADAGKTPEQIAKEYGLPLKGVKQTLALGRLAPEVRSAWRDDKIDDDAAQAFTLEPDQARQAELLKKLGKSRGLSHWTVREAIAGDPRKAAAMLNFVTVEAYKVAGGATATDLFAEKGEVEFAGDVQLLTKLYDAKLKSRVKELEGEGWKWVEFKSDLGYQAAYWPAIAKNKIAVEKRGDYGVMISVDHYGAVEFKYGVQKPQAAKAAAKKAGTAGKPKSVEDIAFSSALCTRLSEQITQAAEATLRTDSNLALAVIAASLVCSDSPARISSGRTQDYDAEFGKTLALMRKKKLVELHAVLADLAAKTLDLGGGTQSNLPLADGIDDDRAIIDALDAKKLNANLRLRFDAEDYFTGVPRVACEAAIAACDPKQPLTGKEKKSELAKLAAELVVKSNTGGKAGWLPPEMRTKAYDGPAAKKAPAAKAKKVTKKKAK